MGENFGPALRGSKKKGEMSWCGQVDEILEMGTLQNKMFFKVSSKQMECCTIFATRVPHDCHALLEKKTIVTMKGYIIGD